MVLEIVYSSILSPTLIGICVNAAPSATRCKPSTFKSSTKKECWPRAAKLAPNKLETAKCFFIAILLSLSFTTVLPLNTL